MRRLDGVGNYGDVVGARGQWRACSPHLWRCGLALSALLGLPYSSRDEVQQQRLRRSGDLGRGKWRLHEQEGDRNRPQ